MVSNYICCDAEVAANIIKIKEKYAKNCANSLIIKERDAKASTNLVQYTELD